jgi:hypothetical protein
MLSVMSAMGRCARKPAGGDGNGADRAPRCERSISAQYERPTPRPATRPLRTRCRRPPGRDRSQCGSCIRGKEQFCRRGRVPSKAALRSPWPRRHVCHVDRVRELARDSRSQRIPARRGSYRDHVRFPSETAVAWGRAARASLPLRWRSSGLDLRACSSSSAMVSRPSSQVPAFVETTAACTPVIPALFSRRRACQPVPAPMRPRWAARLACGCKSLRGSCRGSLFTACGVAGYVDFGSSACAAGRPGLRARWGLRFGPRL